MFLRREEVKIYSIGRKVECFSVGRRGSFYDNYYFFYEERGGIIRVREVSKGLKYFFLIEVVWGDLEKYSRFVGQLDLLDDGDGEDYDKVKKKI